MRRLLRHVLEVGGFQVVEAASHAEYRRCLAPPARAPHVVLLDVALPRFSGLPELAFLRREPRLSQVPVVMLISPADPPEITQLEPFGAIPLIDKPFRVRRLLDTLDALVEAVQP